MNTDREDQRVQIGHIIPSELTAAAVGLSELPSEVLLTILHKLASQDPRSLLHATCACKAFESAATEDPGLWATAFLAPANESMTSARRTAEEQMEGIEAEVDFLGGYKRLLAARFEGLDIGSGSASTNGYEHGHKSKIIGYRSGALGTLKDLSIGSNITGNILVFLRLIGKPVACGVLDSYTRHPQEKELVVRSDRVKIRLRALSPLEESRSELARQSRAARDKVRYSRFGVDPGFITLELYALKVPPETLLIAQGSVDRSGAQTQLLYGTFTRDAGWSNLEESMFLIRCSPTRSTGKVRPAKDPGFSSCSDKFVAVDPKSPPILEFEGEEDFGWRLHWTQVEIGESD